ncbi:phage portal protein [Paenibacillus lutimineralis]|uniref:Phage portal protein n=1 Tax=Paenibacillus lutimineralis TaxID=2707005 RepID=A0A3Q9I8N1_9BACL|nr:phage portal protein [Paenibacillus lutimineralis]AZS15355.1 phage portal protein [Paenibacillus lutimineralis]
MAKIWGKISGEMSRLRGGIVNMMNGLGWSLTGGTIGGTYTLNTTRVNYEFARKLYDNTAEDYKLGAGFAKKIINSTVGFMGLPDVKSSDADAQERLQEFFKQNRSRMQRTHLNAIREADCFVWLTREDNNNPLYPEERKRIVYNIIPPEQVKGINLDPITGEPIEYILESTSTWTDDSGAKRRAVIKQRINKDRRIIEIEGDQPPNLVAGEITNPWGFIPIVHFKNEADETMAYGKSDLESVEPFFKIYHDVFLHAVQGSKMHSTPRLKLKLKDVAAFLRNNFGVNDPAKFAKDGGTINLNGHELILLESEEDAAFIEAKSATGDATALLKFVFYCIASASETPEFVFGVHMPSSLASTKEQMPVFIQKIERKRMAFTDSWQLMCRMVLAMISQAENSSFSTYETELIWETIDPRDSKDVATEIKTIVEALDKALAGRFISLEAAVDFLKAWIDTMQDFETDDEDVPGEKSRIVQTSLFLARLEDGEGLDEEKQELEV